MAAEKLTPMMRQYRDMKERYKDCFLLFRLGDFYEMFFEDAVQGARLLNVALTKRNAAPMCGVPHHALDSYLSKLTRLGKKAAICEQLSDPSLPGIVERGVVRVVTPGTTLDDKILDTKTNNFIAAAAFFNSKIGLAVCDVTTGFFKTSALASLDELRQEIFRFAPAECVVDAAEKHLPDFLKQFESLPVFPHQFWDEPHSFLARHFGVKDLRGFGLEDVPEAVAAAAMLISYLKETQKNDLAHINPPSLMARLSGMVLDSTAVRNLELLVTLRDNKREGSLISVLDMTQTPMGGRALRQWLLNPLHNIDEIESRLSAVAEIKGDYLLKENIRRIFERVLDMERLLARLAMGGGGARDLLGLALSLNALAPVAELLSQTKSVLLNDLRKRIAGLDALEKLKDKILAHIVEAPPLSVKDGGLIRGGVNAELDELRQISHSGKEFIRQIQQREIERTGINSLKVKFNQVFGYYIEITKTNLHLAPADYMRKQTLVNCERFITPELKEYEEKVLGAEAKIKELEYQLFLQLKEEIKERVKEIQAAAQVFGALDSLFSLAFAAEKNNYCRPVIRGASEALVIKDGRHPVIEKTAGGRFVPNDARMEKDSRIMLLTGPNMGGKSTYLRQTALIVLLAHIGSFVPAREAEIPLTDRIFTRVGASDNLTAGQSTFMVEMQEAAQILHYATENSLIILDEIGRGTSTYDGVSLAWAILEYIHDEIGAKTLFATHYHELIVVADKLASARNFSVAVKEDKDSIAFLYRVQEGAVDRSYGIEVARLAGLPQEVVRKAKDILNDLEEGVVDKAVTARAKRDKIPSNQMDIFTEDSPRPHRSI